MLTFFGWTVKDSRSLSFGTFEGWGISKASTFKGKNDDKMEFPEGWWGFILGYTVAHFS